MSVTKELIDQERQQVQTGRLLDIHLHKEGTFLRAYDWSAWLCCRLLHDFKVNKRKFKDVLRRPQSSPSLASGSPLPSRA